MSTEDALNKAFLAPFTSPEDLKNWVFTYLDLDLPMGHIDPDSNSSPVEWLYEAYVNIEKNIGNEIPGYIVYSCREGYKTITTSVLAIMVMVRLGLTVAHMASIESQSAKAVQYLETFLNHIKPRMAANGLSIEEQNKRSVLIRHKNNQAATLTIVICTVTGANSPHVTLFLIDEVDIVRFPQAYEEAQLIPAMMKGQFPLTVKTSTRKFAFGLMQKEIQDADKKKEKVLHWNILDVTERCPIERHQPDLPKQKRFIHPRLPARNISEQEWMELLEDKRKEFGLVEAYHGCAKCPLLPVCKTRLSSRPESDKGGMYKPIDFTIMQFNKVSPDTAEAQLMCWKPSSTGLIYSRFEDDEISGNTYTLAQAWEVYTGNAPQGPITLKSLTDLMIQRGIQFKAAVDWGFRHCFAITVHALMPNGEWWIVDTYAISGLEFENMIKHSEDVRDLYRMVKWYPDNSQPMFIKAYRRRHMPCVDFKKDVFGGIEAVRGQIVNAKNQRRLKVIKHERNEFLIQGFHNHHFKLDAQGKPTQEPDDEEYADVMDTIRYFAQNHFGVKGRAISPPMPQEEGKPSPVNPEQQKIYNDFLSQKIRELADSGAGAKGKSGTGGIIWDFSGDDPTEP